MELLATSIKPRIRIPEIENISSDQFICANTLPVDLSFLKEKCTIPVFAKDNESTISHQEFINTTAEVVHHVFQKECVLRPAVRVSHPYKGRVPEAVGKPVNELQEYEKTIFYERMAFIIEIPTIHDKVSGNKLSLTVGGVRAYNLENLNARKSEEHFKVFIGFKNWVCTNLCISTDGFSADIRVRSLHELVEEIFKLFSNYDANRDMKSLAGLHNYALAERQFAQLIGRAKMYPFIPPLVRKRIRPLSLGDSQINTVVKEYFRNKNFNCNQQGEINLWRFYNLLTGANKSSYIDSFLDRGESALRFTNHVRDCLKNGSRSWYLS
jgi:Domain of unknown function, B. Theta Gene description (DUF3871)